MRELDWHDPTITRAMQVRLVTAPGWPYWELTELLVATEANELVRVHLEAPPLLPKRAARKELQRYLGFALYSKRHVKEALHLQVLPGGKLPSWKATSSFSPSPR